MSVPNAKEEPKAAETDWIDTLTGRVGKITALVTTVGALVLVLLNQSQQIQKKIAEMFAPRQCMQISKVEIPRTIEYSEWERMRIKIGGTNNCNEQLSLYVTFQGRVSNDPRFRLRPPHDIKECSVGQAVQLPQCWDSKRPVALKKGEWAWEVLPPPLLPLSDPVASAMISVTWDVRNVDQPDKPPLASDSAQIEVTNKAARP